MYNAQTDATAGPNCTLQGEGKNELKLLFDMITPKAHQQGRDNFKLNPFPEEDVEVQESDKGRMQRLSSVPVLGQENTKGYADALSAGIHIESLDVQKCEEQSGRDDLLELMDATGV